MTKYAEQLELSYFFWWDINLGRSLVLQEIAIIFPQKVLSYILWLSNCSLENLVERKENICPQTNTNVHGSLFIIAPNWKYSRYSLTGELRNKL